MRTEKNGYRSYQRKGIVLRSKNRDSASASVDITLVDDKPRWSLDSSELTPPKTGRKLHPDPPAGEIPSVSRNADPQIPRALS